MNDTATPASTNRSALVAVANCVTASTSAVAPSAPRKANKGTVNRPRNNPVCNSARMAPNAPPEEMPSRCGSASGLRVTDCRLAPTMARPAPTKQARAARGKRISQMIASRPGDQLGSSKLGAILCSNTPQTVGIGMATLPTLIATDNDSINRPSPNSNITSFERQLFGPVRARSEVSGRVFGIFIDCCETLPSALLWR